MTFTLAMIAFGLIIIQGFFTFLQAQAFRKEIADARRYGNVAMGSKKGFLKQGKIFILACNNEGIITKAKEMRGITLFERFKDIDTYNGMSVYEFEEEANKLAKGKIHENPKKRLAEQQAVLGLINRFKQEDEAEGM